MGIWEHVCFGEQMLQCLIPYSSLYNFQREGSNGNGVSVSHCVVTNELPLMPNWLLREDQEWFDPLESFVFVLYFEAVELKA